MAGDKGSTLEPREPEAEGPLRESPRAAECSRSPDFSRWLPSLQSSPHHTHTRAHTTRTRALRQAAHVPAYRLSQCSHPHLTEAVGARGRRHAAELTGALPPTRTAPAGEPPLGAVAPSWSPSFSDRGPHAPGSLPAHGCCGCPSCIHPPKQVFRGLPWALLSSVCLCRHSEPVCRTLGPLILGRCCLGGASPPFLRLSDPGSVCLGREGPGPQLQGQTLNKRPSPLGWHWERARCWLDLGSR